MPGLQGEHVMAPGSPMKKSKLSLKFLHKKDTKRALDFSEPPPTEEPKAADAEEPEASGCDQVVFGPLPRPSSPGLLLPCEKSENLVPFVGLSNLGNTCYLNSILQVLYYCPGFREEIKKLYSLSKRNDEPQEEPDKSEELMYPQQSDAASEPLPAHLELLGSFNSLITSVEKLQSNFLLNSDNFSDGELAATPRKILNTLRHLNPMYEGFLQHDAQEVLQCILGYVQEACDSIRKERETNRVTVVKTEHCEDSVSSSVVSESNVPSEEDGQTSGKRKSDTEAGNAKKKPKSLASKKSESGEENFTRSGPLTRSKRKSSVENITDDPQEKEAEIKEEKKPNKEGGDDDDDDDDEELTKGEKAPKEATGKWKKRAKLSWLKPSGKQPSIFSKFLSVGKITSRILKNKEEQEVGKADEQEEITHEPPPQNTVQDKKEEEHGDDLDLMERLFQGQLVLRTRCLECESFTERREDFQDISVPVLDEQPSSPEDLPEVSPDPKPEMKTLKWAISQFASVERIVGEDKYFCETCRHYSEAERSLLFDKTPEVITIHLKRFSANGLEMDPYAGLSKVNTPLQTPLSLSLEEWCTRSLPTAAQQYQLFAVVMHSGITISSGHYTAYIRMSNLDDMKVCTQDRKEVKRDAEEEKTAGKESKEVAAVKEVVDYADGELPLKGQRRSLAGKSGSKKLSEGSVGLLGGQRSISSCDLGSNKHVEKAGTSGAKRRKTLAGCSQNLEAGLGKDQEAGDEAPKASCGGSEASEKQAASSLLQYEGKWLLFDDSEVRLFEEEDVLRACSPQTSSSLTPYLLFYRRTPQLDNKRNCLAAESTN